MDSSVCGDVEKTASFLKINKPFIHDSNLPKPKKGCLTTSFSDLLI
ncbi:hypothetical protein NC99_21500 [Sunxiuqinia dokdonensis]|uniref:Uncharacterized protein n=1 Tax=Sunxiuqinia dokdonensis TaxID=1409788 RepID=A0A0L8V959_9BACT|nr:hypothetical protein NC99_21500 [Sunxiuqinia dokdonensis]